jgi:hypothetical protein
MTETTAPVASSPDNTAPVPAADAPASDATTSTVTGSTLLTGDPPADEPNSAATETPATEEASADTEAPKGAPETYEDFTLPEGVALDPEIDTKLKETAKELGLTQEQAQKIADLGAQQSARWAEQLNTQIEATAKQWAEAARADPEIGGNRLGDTLSASKLALDKFATPELKELLETSQLGNHPEIIRLMAKVGRAISDDNFVPGGDTASPKPKSLAERMYPNHPN